VCDIAGGQVLVAYPTGDEDLGVAVEEVLERASEFGMSPVHSLRKLVRDLAPNVHYKLQHEVTSLTVPPSTEQGATAHLYRLCAQVAHRDGGASGRLEAALSSARTPFHAAPNALWSTAAGSSHLPHDFKLLQGHLDALDAIGAAARPGGAPQVRIGVIDSGLDRDSLSSPVVRALNVVDYDNPLTHSDVTDGTGHGTLVCRLIESVAPDADFDIIRVFTDSGCSTDWHIMLGFALTADCDVTNISIESQFAGNTARCGTLGHAAVSSLFEAVIHDSMMDPDRIVVAAAGNQARPELAFPARFPDFVASMSVNCQRERSRFSNRGNVDHTNSPHPNVFVAPGGEHADDSSIPDELLAELVDHSKIYWGTSFSAAYITGTIARHISRLRSDGRHVDRALVLQELHVTADTDPEWYTASEHGCGLVQVPPEAPKTAEEMAEAAHRIAAYRQQLLGERARRLKWKLNAPTEDQPKLTW
jgi:hypothetical protein